MSLLTICGPWSAWNARRESQAELAQRQGCCGHELGTDRARVRCRKLTLVLGTCRSCQTGFVIQFRDQQSLGQGSKLSPVPTADGAVADRAASQSRSRRIRTDCQRPSPTEPMLLCRGVDSRFSVRVRGLADRCVSVGGVIRGRVHVAARCLAMNAPREAKGRAQAELEELSSAGSHCERRRGSRPSRRRSARSHCSPAEVALASPPGRSVSASPFHPAGPQRPFARCAPTHTSR